MKSFWRITFLISFVVVAFGMLGYIYPADFLIKNLANVYSARPPMYVNMKHTVFSESGEVKYTGKSKFLWNGKNDFRAEFNVDNHKESVVFKHGKFVLSPEKFPYYPRLFVAKVLGVFSDGNVAFKFLKELGIEYKKESFGRMDDDVVYIIGAEADSLNKPQFWFSKLRNWPSRLIFIKGKDLIDIKFSGWDHPLLKGYAPSKIECYRNGKLIELFELDSCSIPASLDGIKI